MTLTEMQAIMRECARYELGVHAQDERKAARIALCSAVQVFAAAHQTRADAHRCLDIAFEQARAGEGVLPQLARAMGSLALVGNTQGVSLEVAVLMAQRAAKARWDEWRVA